ncbi:MAG: ROK family protein [Actinomycetota bacterium]
MAAYAAEEAGTGTRSVTVGLDVGGTKVLGVAMAGGEVVAEERVATPARGDDLLDALVSLVGSLGRAAAGRGPVGAVGVGVPGLVDRRGVLRFAPNLRGASGLAVAEGLAARTAVAVEVDNDATCAAWGEHELGAARGLDEVVVVTLGTGIGGGIVTGGRLWRGANGFAGEVGHMVVDPAGPACPCGRRGCWERLASGSGLGRLAREAAEAGVATRIVELAGGSPDDVRGEHVSAALAEDDAEAAEVMGAFARWVAVGLGNLANLLDPQAFVIGGGLVGSGEALLGPVRKAFAAEVEAAGVRPEIDIVAATLGERAGAIGAACLATGSGRG